MLGSRLSVFGSKPSQPPQRATPHGTETLVIPPAECHPCPHRHTKNLSDGPPSPLPGGQTATSQTIPIRQLAASSTAAAMGKWPPRMDQKLGSSTVASSKRQGQNLGDLEKHPPFGWTQTYRDVRLHARPHPILPVPSPSLPKSPNRTPHGVHHAPSVSTRAKLRAQCCCGDGAKSLASLLFSSALVVYFSSYLLPPYPLASVTEERGVALAGDTSPINDVMARRTGPGGGGLAGIHSLTHSPPRRREERVSVSFPTPLTMPVLTYPLHTSIRTHAFHKVMSC